MVVTGGEERARMPAVRRAVRGEVDVGDKVMAFGATLQSGAKATGDHQ